MSSRTLHFPPGPTSAKLWISGLRPPVRYAEVEETVELPDGGKAHLTVSSDDLRLLSQLVPGDLESLTIRDPAPGLAKVVEALGITDLTLAGTCGPGVMAELAAVDALTWLTLNGAPLDARSAEALGGMSQLRSVRLDGATSEATVTAACRLTGLTRLVVYVDSPVGGGLDAVGDLIQLQSAILIAPDLDEGVLSRVASLRELEMTILGGSEFRGEGIKVLAQLPKLSTAGFKSPVIELKTLLGLRESRSLTTLVIRDITAFDDRDAPVLAAISPPVTEIRIVPAGGEADGPTFSLSTQVWMARARPELKVNGFALSEPAIEKYLAAGLGTHPRTGGLELTP